MDIWVTMGIPGIDLDYPRISGCDACGVVEAFGDRVDPSWMGQRVVFNAATSNDQKVRPGDPTSAHLAPEYELIGEHFNGAHRERFLAPVTNVQPVGDADPIKAAAFGLVSLTAYGMIRKADVRPGQTVLITGIGGGVATAALSLCRWLGCRVAVTSRHQWKLDKAVDLGAEHGVLDEGEDWSHLVRRWTSKRGVDVVIDSVGSPIHESCISSLSRGGCFVTCGTTGGPKAQTHLGRVFWNQLRVLGSTMGSNDEFAEVVALFNAGRIEPVVDSVHTAENVRDAIARIEAADQFGKVVIDWNG
jgi:NADPH:quinone reductase-like Zn-dependent oxidoreductase